MIKFLDNNIFKVFLPIFIFLFAFTLRVYGINWDQNQHLHPDERFLTMTTDSMTWPTSLSEYLSPSASKLNPYNVGTSFYVYGTFPTTLIKYFSRFELFEKFQYNNISLTGRFISSLFDVGVVVLVFLITYTAFNRSVALLASFLYSVSVLPIQLSHFFTVDTFLNFFLVLSFYFLIQLMSKNKIYISILLGFSYGAALACKISALYFLPVVVLGLFILLLKTKSFRTIIYYLLSIAFFSYLSFRILDPHAFLGNLFPPKISPQFVKNIKELQAMGVKNSMYPPAIQWQKITPVVFPLENIILWGLGLPLGILSVAAIFYNIFSILKGLLKTKSLSSKISYLNHLTIKQFNNVLVIFWVLFLFFYQGIQSSPSMRYFLPIYPFINIVVANFSITYLFPRFNNFHILYTIFYIIILIWPLSFLKIYSRPHSRVIASKWIYKNIPFGSTLSCDAWDDCLPLNIENVGYMNQYKILSMEPFATDTLEKQTKFNQELQQLDYLVLTSNRAWGSLTIVPDKFPFMSKFYTDLFTGKLNFTKIAEVTSYSTIPLLNIPIPDQSSEEAFTVYDHPVVLIYKKQFNAKPN